MTARIEHVAVWVRDLDRMRAFYTEALGGVSGDVYYEAVILDPEQNRIELTM